MMNFIISKVLEICLWLSSEILKLLSIVWAFYTDVRWAFLIVGIVVLVDTYYGIKASLFKQQPFMSKYLFRIVPKTIMYCGVFALFYLIDFYIINSLIMMFFNLEYALSKAILLGIGIIEATSIDEKRVILGKKPFKELFDKVYNIIKSLITKMNNIKDDNRPSE